MQPKFYCRLCGKDYANLKDLLASGCNYSETHHHEPFRGNPNPPFLCACCGRQYMSLRDLLSSGCPRSPTRHHVPYESA